jgi:hypothetical protein
MKKTPTSVAALATLAFATAAQAVVVDIDSRANGSYLAGGPLNLLPGTTAQPFNAIPLTLGPGTYEITNAALSGYFSAWNYQGVGLASTSHWVWSFVIAEHGGRIIEDVYVNAVTDSQAAMATLTGVATYNGNVVVSPSTSTALFKDQFTLTKTTTLDLYVDDWNWGLSDNYGGVALNIQAIPEPGAAALMLAGLAGVAGLARRKPTRA